MAKRCVQAKNQEASYIIATTRKKERSKVERDYREDAKLN